MGSNIRVAIVHDWLNQTGGAEKVLEEMVSLFPEADIFTSIYAREKMPASYSQWPIHTSFMQSLPGITNRHQPYMPIYPFAFKQFNLDEYDVILSNKSGFCHGVNAAERNQNGSEKTTDGPIHICYCLTPTRFLWSFDQYRARENIGAAGNLLLRPLLPALRRWDRNAAQDVHFFIAISKEIQCRIKEIYGRESTIIYPPVDTTYFTPPSDPAAVGTLIEANSSTRNVSTNNANTLNGAQPDNQRNDVTPHTEALHAEAGENGSGAHHNTSAHHSSSTGPKLYDNISPDSYYLIVSRLIPYKRIDLAIQAFAHLPAERLLIVGDGRDRVALESMITENVTFLGRLEQSQIRELLRYCKAFIFPGLEDFGIAPVEAMSVGRPVIAFAGGGALDTVLPGVSGELFQEQTADSLLAVLQEFNADDYGRDACRRQAERFSAANFRTNLFNYIEGIVN